MLNYIVEQGVGKRKIYQWEAYAEKLVYMRQS